VAMSGVESVNLTKSFGPHTALAGVTLSRKDVFDIYLVRVYNVDTFSDPL